MAREIVDTYPQITLTVGGEVPKFTPYKMSPEEAREAARELNELISTVLIRTTRRQIDVDTKIVSEAVCEHCRMPWTEADAAYNGGCCDQDEANSPTRLKELHNLAERVSDGTYYRFDEGRRDRIPTNWPDVLGTAILVWLEAGRPETEVSRLMQLSKRVQASEWCTVWEDPGPSGCALARLPDSVIVDDSPNHLADELCSLLDDMGLLPATKAVA